MRNRSLLPALDVLLLLVMVLAGLVAGLALLATITDGTVSELTVGLPDNIVASALPDGVEVEEARAVVEAKTAAGYRIAWWIVGPGASLLVVWGASVLRDIVTTAREGDPFVAANVRRLRHVAFIALGYWALTLLRVPVALLIQNHLEFDHATASASGISLAFAIVLVALAEIWQRGVDLREDQDLTV